ncbi:hypothetical protein Ate01nite_09920 [Actinoplanes teichomyceticus]|nr:hypothetical protein Ate01nite_09920 [Actinoplanes teichomyceticus]
MELLLDEEVLLVEEDVLAVEAAGVVSDFFVAESAEPFDFSALTLPERESLR